MTAAMPKEKRPLDKIAGNTDTPEFILHVDLSSREIRVEEVPDELRSRYIGGIGANARLLYEKVKHTVDPLSPDNVLILGQGPLVGTPFPTASRTVATAKSPMTDAYGHSGAMGQFGPLARGTGFAHMIFYGKAPSPVYILVRGLNQIEIRDARDLWGLSIPQTVAALSARHAKGDIACIGPAGENRVRFASIMVSLDRTIARLGMGCVMGSKNLKAVVVQSTRKAPVADRSAMAALSKTYQKLYPRQMLSVALGYFGTPLVVGTRAAEGTLAARNFRDELPPEYKNLTEDKFLAFQAGRKGCWRCPVACHHSWKIEEGKFAGVEGTKVEGGNVGPLGINLALFDYPAALAKILTAASGRPWSGTQLMECAERIIQVEKAFNVKCGMTRKDDYFVKKPAGRFYRPQDTVDLDHPGMLDEYYHYRGYSPDGLPTAARLKELGLNDVLEELQRLDKVSDAEVPSLASIMAQQDVY
jgi:aldehyde:ferredoxin oxidoreductase